VTGVTQYATADSIQEPQMTARAALAIVALAVAGTGLTPVLPAGEGTRSVTPLVWSHAGLLRLAWTIQRGAPVDQQPVVADRYRA